MRYALIDTKTGIVANVVEVEEGDGSTAPEGFSLMPAETASIGDTWNGDSFISPPGPVPTTEELWAAARSRRKPLLQATDAVAIRCFKAGVAWPDNWKIYTQALRDITEQADPANLEWPIAPDMPGGV